MPQGATTFVNVCVTVPSSAGSVDIVVKFNGTVQRQFRTRPLPNGDLQVCVRVPTGQGGVVTAIADTHVGGAVVP